MTIQIRRKLNYFNEALLLATIVYNRGKEYDADLPIPVQSLGISLERIEQDYELFVSFLKSIRTEARELILDEPELSILFQRYEQNEVPEIMYFLTYSRLNQSIQDYTLEELMKYVKKEFIENMFGFGFEITDYSFEQIDRLTMFNEQQRYMIYKFFNNIGQIFEKFYLLLIDLENIIRTHESKINSLLIECYDTVEEILENKDFLEVKKVVQSHNFSQIEYTFLLQLPQFIACSGFLFEGELQGICFLGVLPYLMKIHPDSMVEKKEELVTKFSSLSDSTRFSIIVLLAQKAMYGRELAQALSLSAGTMSHHLSLLLKEGLLTTEMEGKKIYYKVNSFELQRMGRFLIQIGGFKDDE